MKTEKEIKKQLNDLTALRKKKNKEYSSLGQIAALDSFGQRLDKEIQEMNGRINALKWVLQ